MARLPALLTSFNGSVFGLDRTSAGQVAHKIVRLGESGAVTTILDLGDRDNFVLLTSWSAGLAAVVDRLTSQPGTVQRRVLTIDVTASPAVTTNIAQARVRDDAPPSLVAWHRGLVFSMPAGDRFEVQAWDAQTSSITTVTTVHAPPLQMAVSVDDVVGQNYEERGLWVAGIGHLSTLALPHSAATLGRRPVALGDSLAWVEQRSESSDDSLFVWRRRTDRPAFLVQVIHSQFMQWWTECLLISREYEGLFVISVCPGKPTKFNVLDVQRTRKIFNPSSFAVSPDSWLFALQLPGVDKQQIMRLRGPSHLRGDGAAGSN